MGFTAFFLWPLLSTLAFPFPGAPKLQGLSCSAAAACQRQGKGFAWGLLVATN